MGDFSLDNSGKPVEQTAGESEYTDFSQKEIEYFHKEYSKLSAKEKKLLAEALHDSEKFNEHREACEKLLFTHRHPSPEQFLDPNNGFLSYDVVEGLYPHVKRDFLAAMNPAKNYPVICMYGSTRSGKSVLARLFVLYTTIFVNYLRDPHRYFQINKMSKISLWLISFKDEKTKELLLDPLLTLLNNAPKFRREHFEKTVYSSGVGQDGVIPFSEAGKFGAITFPKLKIATGRDPSSLVGSDICAGVLSELAFFKEYVPGLTDDDVMEVYNKLTTRIKNTIGHSSFPCWTYLDTSANNADSPLEKHVLVDIANNPRNYFQHYCLWELRPQLYPIWNNDRTKTFKVITGDGTYPAKLVQNEVDLDGVPTSLIIDVPIDLYEEFSRPNGLTASIRDIAGRATTVESKFIQNAKVIDRMWEPHLENIESIIVVDSSVQPQKYIWTIISHKFFTCYDGKNYKIKRAAQEPRWIHIDTAYSAKGDVVGVTMLHKEWSQKLNDPIYVVDFSFAIGPGENGINLEALTWFVHDLAVYGAVSLVNVTVDTFQTQNMIQFWQRSHIPCEKLSVDISIEPYMNLFSCLLQESVKAGKNVFLKNNLMSLYRKRSDRNKEKIDHTLGKTNNKYNGDFNNSDCGVNAKDVSDSLAGAVFSAQKSKHVPVIHYERENMRIETNQKIEVDFNKKRTPEFQSNVNDIYKQLHKGRF